VNELLRVPVYYDFASTLCYVAQRVTGRMADELAALAVELAWTPIDLATLTGWTRGAEVNGPRRANALRVARDLRVEVRMPRQWLDSRLAGAVAAELAGTPREPSWRERVFSAVYEEGRSLEGREALAPLARDLGLELEPLLTPAALARLDEQTRRARELEVTGVPTFLLGTWAFGGIQEERTLRSVLSRWAARQRGCR
jgi:predicted DsbA family dithiol-disulfide isomerase